VIASQLSLHLRPDGIVLMEIGYTQGTGVKQVLESAGLVDVSVERDMSGKDRFAVGRCPS
jgi:release factor glutamine methyltransferase